MQSIFPPYDLKPSEIFLKSPFPASKCGRQNMAPKDICILILGTNEYITLCAKRDSTSMIKLKILKWEDFPDYLGGPIVIMRVPYKEAGK